RDAWFVGYTPEVLALVWVGFDDNTSMELTGAEAALPIWAELMSAILHRISGNEFRVPEGIVTEVICVESGQLALRSFCPVVEEEFFLKENKPEMPCSLHAPRFGRQEEGR
ncbi:MAG: penicillin-binding protein 1A, partial [Deltaproteobacteria bacterium]|nr:penicillin-binding protein 1A [Deltaproteobacteria bacterium]